MMTCVFGLLGMEIGALLKAKNPENRALVASYLVTHAVGGITEPALFGVGIRYKKTIICS
jgi:PTS system beta-glucosides-specific IIC component